MVLHDGYTGPLYLEGGINRNWFSGIPSARLGRGFHSSLSCRKYTFGKHSTHLIFQMMLTNITSNKTAKPASKSECHYLLFQRRVRYRCTCSSSSSLWLMRLSSIESLTFSPATSPQLPAEDVPPSTGVLLPAESSAKQ